MAWFGNRSGDTLQDTPPGHNSFEILAAPTSISDLIQIDFIFNQTASTIY